MMFRSGKDERGGRNTSNYGRGSGNGSGGNGLSYGSASDFSGSRQNARGGSNRAKVLPKRHGKSETVVSLQPIVWSKESLVPISKNFYSEHQNVARRSQYEIDAWYQENQVTIEGYDIPRPVFDFSEADFPAPIVQRLFKSFQKPTVIQSISWPLALSGRDLVSIAKTGSGKTLAFVLPALVHIMGQPSRGHPKYPLVLVLLPTRELAQQVQEVSRDYCQILNLSLTCLFGGAPKNSQLYDLQRGVDLVIATPGRLMDFLTAGKTSLKRCTYLVLDEADRMLDMGFEPQIRKIISQIRPDRQTLMFSATWPREVRKLASDFLTNVAHLNVGSLELSANHNITQIVEIIDEGNKQQRLISILNQIMDEDDCKTIIFVETKRKADDLTRWMRRDGWPALCIHGDKGQSERDWALGEFKAGKTPILLATDVAARGLDVDDIKYVINYDYSNNSEDYVHRIGRTGRREKKGTAYTFFTHENSAKAKDLIKVLQEANQHVPDELTLMAQSTSSTSNRSRYGGGLKRNFSGDGGHSGFFAKRGRFEDRREGRP